MRGRALALLLLLPLATTAQPAKVQRVDALWRSHRTAAAHALVDSLLPHAVAAGDSLLELQLLARRGQMHAALGRGLDAIPPLDRALQFSRALDDTLMIEANLRWLAVARGYLGDYAVAESLFVELVSTASASGHGESLAWGETGLGYYDRLAGRLAASREHYLAAVGGFRALRHAHGELFAINGLGIVRTELGEHDGAREAYRRSRELSREMGMLGGEALALNNLGALEYSLGDPGRAMEYFQAARDLQEQDGNPREVLLVDGNLHLCLAALGRLREARELLESNLRRGRELGFRDLTLRALRQLAELDLDAGEAARADSIFATIDRESLSAKDEQELMLLRSRIELALGGAGPARARLEERAEWAGALEDPSLRERFALELGQRCLDDGDPAAAQPWLEEAAGSVEPALALRACVQCARAEAALGHPELARNWLSRGAELWEAERSLPLDPDWREVRGAAGVAIFPALARSILASASETNRADAFALLQRFKARTLLERLEGPGAPARPAPVLTLDRLQEDVLGEGELLLDFSVGEAGALLFAVTPASVRVIELPALPAAVEGLGMASAAVDALTRSLREQRELCFAGVEDLIASARHVIVVPDGPLHSLPLAALLEGAGVVASRVPSAALLAELRERPPLAAMGLLRLYAPGPDLPGAWREIDALNLGYRNFERDVLTDSTASGSGFAHASLLHFATHARADDEHPWRSALQGAEGFRLEAREIGAKRIGAGLVVLSACESAAGRSLPGEGVQGLASAFLVAGSRSVLATLWPVDDAVSADLVQAFYAGLAEGKSAAGALASAQAAVRARPATRHPAHWAGYVLIGDGATRLHIEKARGFTRPRAILAYALAGLGLWLLAGRLRSGRNSP